MTGFPLMVVGLALACLAPLLGDGLFVAGLLVAVFGGVRLMGELA